MKSTIKKMTMLGIAVCAAGSLYVVNKHKKLNLINSNKELIKNYNDDISYYVSAGYDDEDPSMQASKEIVGLAQNEINELEENWQPVLSKESADSIRHKKLNTLIALHQEIVKDCEDEMAELTTQGFSSKRRRVKNAQERKEHAVIRIAQLEEQLKQPCRGAECASETLEQLVDVDQEITEMPEEQIKEQIPMSEESEEQESTPNFGLEQEDEEIRD